MAEKSLFAERLLTRFPGSAVHIAQPRGETILVTDGDWHSVCLALRDEFGFESLIDVCGIDYLGYGSDEWDTDTSSQGFSRGVEGRGPGRFGYGQTPSQQLAEPDGIGALPVPEKRFAATAQLLSIEHNRRLSVRCFAADDDLPRMSSPADRQCRSAL